MAKNRLLTGLLVAVMAAAMSPVVAAGTASPESVIVWGRTTTEAHAAVEAAGGDVTTTLSIIGGVAAELTPDEQGRVASAGLSVADDRAASVASADGFEPVQEADLQFAAMNPGGDWGIDAGAGVGVALVDTGVTEVEDLRGRVVHGPDFSGSGAPAVDEYGHGTFMAGLIAGDGSQSKGAFRHLGIAPAAHVVSVKVAGADGSTTLSKIIAGIGWVVANADQHAVRVLNLSVAVPTLSASYLADPLSGAVEAAWASGITVVAAAGNDGDNGVASPGRDPWIITVGALDTNGTLTHADDTVPSWSSRGADRWSTKPELLAPGVSVISTLAPGSTVAREHPQSIVEDTYFLGSGSSMATALTAGAAAVLTEHHAAATPDDIKAALVRSADPISGAIGGAVDLAEADLLQADESWWQRHQVSFNGLGIGLRDRMPWAQAWAGTRWAGTRWAGTRWAGTRWAEEAWTGTRWADEVWGGTRWAGTRWAGTRWAGTRWAGTRWAGTRWANEVWTGTRWAGTRWAGTRWADSDWAGTRWAGTRWTGTRWAGGEWAGTRWAGTRWAGTRWADAGWTQSAEG
ncbi:MAG: S8 family serine peptidase [Acidimicrobiia bacterium]